MEICYLCKSPKKDDILYGEFLQKRTMGVHTFCLYLSSNLSQNGKDDEGFLGFLLADIKREERRISKLKCCYCHKIYANVGCCSTKCRRAFHFICGLENEAANEFCKSYRSFCHQHVLKENMVRPSANTACLICYDNLRGQSGRFKPLEHIRAPCCRNGWFHKLCLQKFAKTAGYFFKCPLCNDSKIFREKLPANGIFIPNQDAAWELEPNAFAELLERPSECAASQCENLDGRSSTSSSNPLILCSTCGSTAMHRMCLPENLRGNRFHCADCTIAMENGDGDSGRESLNSHINRNDEEYGEIDVCNVSDHENLEVIRCLLPDNNSEPVVGSSDDEKGKHRPGPRRLSSYSSDSSETLKENRDPSAQYNKVTTDNEVPITSTSGNARKHENKTSQSKNRNEIAFTKEMTTSRRQNNILHVIDDDDVEIIHDDNNLRNNRKQLLRRRRRVNYIDSDESVDGIEHRFSTNRIKRLEQFHTISEESDDDDDIYIKRSAKSTKKKVLCIDSDDDIPTKRARCDKTLQRISIDDSSEEELELNNNGKRLERDSAIAEATSEESDEDDDPLENFTKFIQRKINNSCIAQRTRTKTVHLESPRDDPNDRPSICGADKITTTARATLEEDNERRNVKFSDLSQRDSNKNKNNLDISCIAKRTRRKSMFCQHSNMNSKIDCSNGDTLNSSCIAIRTRGRRKTVCSETLTEKEKQQRYGKMEISFESAQSTQSQEIAEVYDMEDETDDDATCSSTRSEESGKHNPLEISCIANRTRKRRPSLVQSDTSSSSCSSVSSYSSYYSATSNDQLNLYNRKPSLMSETATRSFRYHEKFPKQCHEFAFLSSKQVQCKSYHPNDQHQPHVNNRRRI